MPSMSPVSQSPVVMNSSVWRSTLPLESEELSVGGLASRDAVKTLGRINFLRDTATQDFSKDLLNAKV